MRRRHVTDCGASLIHLNDSRTHTSYLVDTGAAVSHGTQFTYSLWSQLTCFLHISHITTTTFHPQSNNGMVHGGSGTFSTQSQGHPSCT
jgi:hypothetical protein